jgi:hypothetical protein
MTLTITREMLIAELLKLRRNRALLGFAFLLSVGVGIVYFGYNAIQHAADPTHHLPAGGMDHFTRAVRMLGLLFGALTATLIGTEAGTADFASGVYRDLVATGRSRLALYAVRAPAAVVLTLVFNAGAFLVTIAGTFVFAGALPTPSTHLVLESAAWVVLCNVIVATLAASVGSVTRSRGITLTAVIGWETVVTSLVLNATSLGSARDAVLNAPLDQLLPVGPQPGIRIATGVAIVVLSAWAAIPTAIGAWRTEKNDA